MGGKQVSESKRRLRGIVVRESAGIHLYVEHFTDRYDAVDRSFYDAIRV